MFSKAKESEITLRTIMVLAGAGLILVQIILFREIGTVLHSTELSLTLVLVTFFLSLTIGYLISTPFSQRAVEAFVLTAGVFQIFLVPIIRALGIVGEWSGWELVGHLSILGLTGLVASSLFSIFLPRFSKDPKSLVSLYLWELSGSALGVGLSFMSIAIGHNLLISLHQVVVIILLILVLGRKRNLIFLIPSLVAVAIFSINLREPANRKYFEIKEGIYSARVLTSQYSEYQKIDIIEGNIDSIRKRFFYLDGWRQVGREPEDLLNKTLAELAIYLPNVPHNDVMIAGSGISTIVPVLLPVFKHVVSVEVDKDVVREFLKWTRPDLIKEKGWEVVIDDAYHYLLQTDRTFDVVINNVTGPFYLQSVRIFSENFFQLARKHLNFDGVYVTYLPEPFSEKSKSSYEVITGLRNVFDSVAVFNHRPSGNGFAIAGALPYEDMKRIVALAHWGDEDVVWFTPEEVYNLSHGANPINEWNYRILWRSGWKKLFD